MQTEAVKLERERRRTLRQEHNWERERLVWDRVLTPNVVRLGLMAGIIAYSTHCARSKENVGAIQSALAFALPGIGIPMLAADAGIKSPYALGAISAAGIGYTTGQMLAGWSDAGVNPLAGFSDAALALIPGGQPLLIARAIAEIAGRGE